MDRGTSCPSRRRGVRDGHLRARRNRVPRTAHRLAAEMPFLRVIHHEQNLGYGAALISGFKNAKKDLIFYTDGDGQYDVREMHNLLAELKPHIDLVNGYKVKRADAWYRISIAMATAAPHARSSSAKAPAANVCLRSAPGRRASFALYAATGARPQGQR